MDSRSGVLVRRGIGCKYRYASVTIHFNCRPIVFFIILFSIENETVSHRLFVDKGNGNLFKCICLIL